MFEIYKDKTGKFRYRLKAKNGEAILVSEGFTTKKASENIITSVIKSSQDEGNFELKESKNGRWHFVLKDIDGRVVGASQMYISKNSAKKGIALVINSAKVEKVYYKNIKSTRKNSKKRIKQSQKDEEIKLLREIDANPSNYKSYELLANFYKKQGKINDAEEVYSFLSSNLADSNLNDQNKKDIPSSIIARKLASSLIDGIKSNEVFQSKIREIIFTKRKVLNLDNNHESIKGSEQLAEFCAEIIDKMDKNTETSFGIFGKWGRGKTFLTKLIVNKLKESKKHNWISVDYHAWKYQETPANWAYLYEQLVEEYLKVENKSSKWLIASKNPFLKKIQKAWTFIVSPWFKLKGLVVKRCKIVRLNLKRNGWGYVISAILSICLFVLVKILPVEGVSELVKNFGWLVFVYEIVSGWVNDFGLWVPAIPVLVSVFAYSRTPRVKILFTRYATRPSFTKLLGYQSEIQEEIMFLFDVWLNKDDKVVLCVDDIDRCNEKQIVQIMDALRIILENKKIAEKLVMLIAIDLRILKLAIRFKYQKFELERDGNDKLQDGLTLGKVAYDYLDKLFLLGIDQPDIDEKEIDDFYRKISYHAKAKNKDYSIDSVEAASSFLSNFSNWDLEQKMSTEKDIQHIKSKNKMALIQIADSEMEQNIKVLQTFQNKFKFFTLTPRNIKVFHYRFVLATKFLGNKYSEEDAEFLMGQLLEAYLIKRAEGGGFTDKDIDNFKIKNESKAKNKDYKKLFEGIFIKIDDVRREKFARVVEIITPY